MNPAFDGWIAALERRHLASLTRSEATRALRALSSCYVERRDLLADGSALQTAGKRAAFALYYGPLHFLTVSAIVRALGSGAQPPRTILDLGCGTGAAGAAWALAASDPPQLLGIDRSGWAVQEANWTYGHFDLRGRAIRGDVVSARLDDARAALLIAYAVNELPPEKRNALLERACSAIRAGRAVLVVEPIARRGRTWWDDWSANARAAGAREDEWRFPLSLPLLLRDLAKGAGLKPLEITARTLAAHL
ncbi:MAG: methyltransferase domain-containing protein [Vicinamibacterales bacterium]